MIQFLSLKQHVEAWLKSEGITNCSVVGLGSIYRGVVMFIHGETSDEFIIKQGSSFVTPHYKCYLTKERYPRKVYISMVRNTDK